MGRCAALGLALVLLAGCAATPSPTPERTTPAAPATPTPTPTTTRLVAVGDSTLTGYLCGCDGPVPTLARLLETRHPGTSVVDDVLAVNGSTSADLLADVTTDAATRGVLAEADVVVIITGANDLDDVRQARDSGGCDAQCYGPAVDAVGSRVTAILDAVGALRQGRPTRVLVAGYWNVFEDGAVAQRVDGPDEVTWSRTLTDAVNHRLARAASTHAATYVDLVTPFRGADGRSDPTALLAEDGDHPNAQGVAVLAATLAEAVS